MTVSGPHSMMLALQVPPQVSYHLRCPADQHIEAWMKSITNHRLLANEIIDILNFITSQEDLVKSEQPE
ncbi:hypothetical protein AVEN_160578-1 [Araneus ventricosus]|uniref:PH domain-containing protein n=1 Tax=Araneus ventricosus TaxID=182803 RepID=A0A4Y2TN06_ARAVE|nr:hypothetical protein AVEN_160578-1 [Araneus ventricosus]